MGAHVVPDSLACQAITGACRALVHITQPLMLPCTGWNGGSSAASAAAAASGGSAAAAAAAAASGGASSAAAAAAASGGGEEGWLLVQQGCASIDKPQLQVWSHAVDVTAACKPPISCQSQASGQWKLAPSPT